MRRLRRRGGVADVEDRKEEEGGGAMSGDGCGCWFEGDGGCGVRGVGIVGNGTLWRWMLLRKERGRVEG